MRSLITGGAGLLGRNLIRAAPAAAELHATWRAARVSGAEPHRVELSDAAAVDRLVRRVRPKVVIHTAYSTAAPERDILEATRALVAACAAQGAALIHLSTDALLDGEHAPYTEAAEPAPVHDYGRWKARAERFVRSHLPGADVVRTSLITELEPPDPRCAWVIDALRRGDPIALFTDELRCPIAADDLATQLWELASLPPGERGGVWNLAGPESVSRYTLGLLIAARHRLDPAGLTPALAAASPEPRPRDLRLLTGRADRRLVTRARPIGSLLLPRAEPPV